MSARRRPELQIVLPLEGRGSIRLSAESAEDERELRLWLQRSWALRTLPAAIARLLHDLDAIDRETAA